MLLFFTPSLPLTLCVLHQLVRMKIQNYQMIQKGVTKSTIYNYMVIQDLKWQFTYFGSLLLEL